MRNWKRVVIIMALMITGIGSLCGCERSAKKNIEELQIKEPKNHLASWREELPEDGEYTSCNAGAVRGIEIRKGGETVFAASYEPREGKDTFDYWDISVPYQSIVSVNTEELYSLFDTILQIRWDQKEDISKEEAGIDVKGTSIFFAYNREQKSGEKGMEDPTGTRTILIGNADGQGNYYASLEGSEEVVCIDQVLTDSILSIDPFQYILKIPALINVDTVEKVQILLDENLHNLESRDGNWKIDGKSIEKSEFQSLYGKLLGIMISGEIDKEARIDDGNRQPVLSLRFIRNIDEASDMEVIYYDYDDQSMSVSVNGREYFLTEREDVYKLIEDIEKSF